MADNPLRQGHAAWVWTDLGQGKRWELAVPAEGTAMAMLDVYFPTIDQGFEFEDLDDCPMRAIEAPTNGPTEAEIAAAARCARAHGGDDDDHG